MANNSSKKLQGKIALITGGNSGIGLATAELFHQHGAKVIVTARSAETYKKATSEYGHLFDVVQCDVSNLSELDRLFKYIADKYTFLDVVFANAGIAKFLPTSSVDSAFYDELMSTNLKGAYFTVAKALPMLRDGSSVILNSSGVAVSGLAGSSVYSATKAALRSFARTWTAEIPPSRTRFNVVAPGLIATPIQGKLGLSEEQQKEFAEGLMANVPAKRVGQAIEIANVALFLASDDSSYIVGANIAADGGFTSV